MAERYSAWSSYHYAGLDPLMLSDPQGAEYDMSALVWAESGGGNTATLLADLQQKTGLQVYIDDNLQLRYKTDANGNPIVTGNGGSSIARDLLINMINSPEVLPVTLDNNTPLGSRIAENGMMVLDRGQINGFINGASGGLESTTQGWAMTFLHESLHTALNPVGPQNDGSKVIGDIGPVESTMNLIRGQLGPSYGTRTSYSAYLDPNTHASYLPYSITALNSIMGNSRRLPPTGYYIVTYGH